MRLVQLNTVLSSLLSSNPSEELVRDFVYVCRNIAYSYLQVKIYNGKLDVRQFGIPVDDLALDCIAPLFHRDAHHRFVELDHYFKRNDLRKKSPEELLSMTRRLVLGMVNEELFRIYKESDPSLSNAIRNIKIHLKFSRVLVPVVRNNETWVQALTADDQAELLPILPSELLEAQLYAKMERHCRIPRILELAAEILGEQDQYQQRYPLLGLAFIVRSLVIRASSIAVEATENSPALSGEEIRNYIHSTIERTRTSLSSSYVAKGKVTLETFELYFDCIGDILEAEYVSNDWADLSYYDIIHKRAKRLSQSEYRKNHRIYLEYLAKLTRGNFLESIKNELLTE